MSTLIFESLESVEYFVEKKNGLQDISPHFEPVSSSIEVFRSASGLLCAECRHIHSHLLNKKYVIWWRFAENGIVAKDSISVLKKV